jgi:hypothetical protein
LIIKYYEKINSGHLRHHIIDVANTNPCFHPKKTAGGSESRVIDYGNQHGSSSL